LEHICFPYSFFVTVSTSLVLMFIYYRYKANTLHIPKSTKSEITFPYILLNTTWKNF
jgi:hypothetical protein